MANYSNNYYKCNSEKDTDKKTEYVPLLYDIVH
jgi:hypothetical protein